MSVATRLKATLIGLVLAAGNVGCSSAGAGSLHILVPWSGPEKQAFESVVASFKYKKHHINVITQSTRALTQELNADIRQNNAPDLAVLPSAGAVYQYASQGEAYLDGIVDPAQYDQPWNQLMTTGDKHKHVLALPVKVNLKSLIWYSPRRFPDLAELPKLTLTQLTALGRTIEAGSIPPWCLGVASGATSGWPGTDWIEDILLSQDDTAAYNKWINGKPAWSKGPVEQAWRTWGQIIGDGTAIAGGHNTPLLTSVGNAAKPMTATKPGCYLDHGTFIDQNFAANLKPGTDYAYVPFPSASAAGHAYEVSADFIGMFHKTPQSTALIRYLSSKPAQRQWAKAPGGHAFSANAALTLGDYPGDKLTQGIARTLVHGSGFTLCFDASDAMPPDLGDAFDHAVLQYLHDPADLPSILKGLDRAQTAEPSSTARAPGDVCGTP